MQLLAVAGMVAYLATYKTVTELGAIAAVYTKNSDILAARLEFTLIHGCRLNVILRPSTSVSPTHLQCSCDL